MTFQCRLWHKTAGELLFQTPLSCTFRWEKRFFVHSSQNKKEAKLEVNRLLASWQPCSHPSPNLNSESEGNWRVEVANHEACKLKLHEAQKQVEATLLQQREDQRKADEEKTHIEDARAQDAVVLRDLKRAHADQIEAHCERALYGPALAPH